MKNRKNIIQLLMISSLFFILAAPLVAQERPLSWYLNGPQKEWTEAEHEEYWQWRTETHDRSLRKSKSDPQILRRQKAIMKGNKITTEVWNYGSISNPNNRVTDIVWEGLGYGYEFAPFICAEVPVPRNSHRDVYAKRDENGNVVVDAGGDTVWVARVISDGLVSLGGEVSPDGKEFWGWEPLAYSDDGRIQYADPNSDRLPTSNDIDRDKDGKPDSWPSQWYDPNLRRYVWPGALSLGSTNSDMEAFFVVDDRMNKEFQYYPFPEDKTRRGLGVQVECRYYQWANPLAEDIIFLIYKVTNKSDKDLNDVLFGMWGDPHVGGPNNYDDDLAFFLTEINMVYAWDENGRSDIAGKKPGYFGYKFLESPGNPHDGIDNDLDGMIDESRENGIDDDGDWDPDKDDIGVDGIPNTNDYGEGDGIPTAGEPFDILQPGEPNFEWTDLDESDMIGLTSFAAPPFSSQNRLYNDDYAYRNFLVPGKFDSANSTQAGDNVFLYGSGNFTLHAGESRRFSIALLIGQNLDDLKLNAATAQQIYEINYQFAKPPNKPNVTAVPGDEKVTLYWDDVAEDSYDPVSEDNDFEGYVIYRSTDPQFLDQQNITDATGTSFLFEPLKTPNGAAVRFDLINEYEGLSDLTYSGRGTTYHLGNNTGLRHSYTDSNNVINGQTYYYAVVSYDHGDDSLKIAPTECSKNITVDPERNEVVLDVNTVEVVPRAPVAGFVTGSLAETGSSNNIIHHSGIATGDLKVDVVDHRRLEEDNEFIITFQEEPTRYTVEDKKMVENSFTAFLDQYIKLDHQNIKESSIRVRSTSGDQTFTEGSDYEFLPDEGKIQALSGGNMQDQQVYVAEYTYFPIVESRLLDFEESNPFFDGMKLYARDKVLALDEDRIGWSQSAGTNYVAVIKPFNNIEENRVPADYEVRFFDTLVDSSSRPNYGYIKTNFEVWDVTTGKVPDKQRFVVLEVSSTEDSLWSPGERVIILEGDEGMKGTWEFTFNVPEGEEAIEPKEGDVFYISTSRPFSAQDVYSFKTKASAVDNKKATHDLDRIAVVPNPYVVTNVIEPLDRQNPRDRGPRRIYFSHLPQKCTIRIYTLTGELVDVLEHDSMIDDGKEYWDLTSRDNFPISYGVYIYHVDAGELGEKIGRFAVIK
jgi:hypothetical protein